ncbi:hypothetical protein A1D22_00570 [Pasteurellaceae bacterium LFhippo2]|nr:hypothetical protein [Pasteurellaceae bacterium LFhippo2]
MTPIFIINLETSIDRKLFITQQFESLSQLFDYQFFPAIYGKNNPNHPLFSKYNKNKRLIRKGNEMSLSQLGCFASHYLLWEKCVELNQPIIVLEDDSIIQDNFLECYHYLNNSADIEFSWLSPPAFKGSKGKTITQLENSNTILISTVEKHDNTTGYYLTPKAAQSFIRTYQEWIFEVDVSMQRFWENNVQAHEFVPACIKPNQEFDTNISVDKRKSSRTLKIKLQREFYKLIDNINRSIYLLKSR